MTDSLITEIFCDDQFTIDGYNDRQPQNDRLICSMVSYVKHLASIEIEHGTSS